MTFMSKCQKSKVNLPQLETGNTKQAWPNEVSGGGGSVTVGGSKLRCPAPISRLRVEKIEGGLMVAGVVVAANCQIILPIFGFLFLLVGCVLTAASYRGPGEDEEPDHYEDRIAFTGNSRILGPACIVVGFFMLVAGCVLCVLTRRARRREQTIGFHCPLHGDFYPLSPVSSSRTIGFIKLSRLAQMKQSGLEKGGICGLCFPRKRGPGAIAVGPPQCPHSQVSSTRSSIASSPHSQCPTPLPFLVNSGSVGGIVAPVAQSPDQPFGSIRSLAAGREVASFPLSRTPTPPPSTFERSPNLVQVPDEERLVDTNFEPAPVHRNGPRKSVSIVLPTEEKG
ncbi:uncharacterized protein LOC108915062 isoform X2 [Anoplophora glabripennis]|uniref:uncharacterized protein LOC108915062 isoform X2 n=1 Tax=Anoplophora glabripennis TaxID=217634 RepID=UPI0008755A04|nr:uncharacterized protein LOC108915062 isoform X2 [Anoplophora glabripennis]